MAHERIINSNESDTEKDYILFVNGIEFIFESYERASHFITPRCENCNRVIKDKNISFGGHFYCSIDCSPSQVCSLLNA